MEKRDLKADLEQLKRTKKVFEPQQVTFETPEDEIVPAIDILDQQLYTLVGLGEFAVKYGEEWLERAIEAEALVRELREALNKIVYPVRYLQNEADGKNVSLDGRVATELANSSHWLKSIAKEVLGDGEVR